MPAAGFVFGRLLRTERCQAHLSSIIKHVAITHSPVVKYICSQGCKKKRSIPYR